MVSIKVIAYLKRVPVLGMRDWDIQVAIAPSETAQVCGAARATASAALCPVIALNAQSPPIMAFRRHVYFLRISSASLRMLRKFCGYLGLARSPCSAAATHSLPCALRK